MENVVLRRMADRWPSAIVSRTEIERFTGGLLKEKYLANLDCQGKGPSVRIRIGRKIAYPVESVIAFLENRAELVQGRKNANSNNG